jgi:hypothetical protein
VQRKYIPIYVCIQQDATLHSLFICGNYSTCFGWKYYPKHVKQFPHINKLCNVASCWIYVGILLAHPIFHISRIRVNILLKLEFSRQIFDKYSNIKFNKNLSSGSLIVPYGRTDVQTDGRTDRHDGSHCHFSNFMNAPRT